MTKEEVALTINDAFQMGLSHQMAGRLDEAESIYRQVLAAAPEHASSLHYLGIVRFKRGDAEEALRLMKQSVALRPRDASFLQNLGGLLKDLKRHEKRWHY